MDNGNKQSILVLFFFLFVIGAVAAVILYDKNSEKTTDNFESNEEVTSNIPKVTDSKEVTIVTSNKSNTQTSNKKTSNKTSSKTSNKTSTTTSNGSKNNKNEIPISYFIAHIDNNKIYVGGVAKISVDIKPDNATNKSVKYYTSDSSVATVSSNGVITGKNPGVCTITIDVYNGGKAEVDIQVLKLPANIISNSNKSNTTSNTTSNKSNSNTTSNTQTTVHVSSVALNMNSLSLKKGTTAQLSATVYPSNANDQRVTWSSSNSSVATVNSSGKVTAVSAGQATIYVRSVDGGKTAAAGVTVTNPKNGWVTEGGKKYYYENDNRVKDTYRNYIYLDKNGVAQDKIGNFDVTLYGATAWVAKYSANDPYLCLNSEPHVQNTCNKLSPGTKVKITGNVTNGYFPVKVVSTGATGYIWAESTFVNLPDLMPSMKYDINAASSSYFVSGGYNIPNVTNVKLYKFSKTYNVKIGRKEYYAPLAYPVAIYLQKALINARNQGYNFVIYDTYRPTPVEEYVYNNYMTLYNNNANVRAAINRNGYNLSWFMTSGYSKHSQGIAIDMGLTNSSGTVLAAQTKYGVLDESSTIDHNNANANKLRSIMLSVKDSSIMTNSASGCTTYHSTNDVFYSLKSEWWHFDFRCTKYNNKQYESFYITD